MIKVCYWKFYSLAFHLKSNCPEAIKFKVITCSTLHTTYLSVVKCKFVLSVLRCFFFRMFWISVTGYSEIIVSCTWLTLCQAVTQWEMEGDYLIQVDQQMTCAIFVHNVSPNIPEKKDNMQCVEDIWIKRANSDLRR